MQKNAEKTENNRADQLEVVKFTFVFAKQNTRTKL